MKTIVVVNDNEDFLDAIKGLLEDENYNAVIIHEGSDAFKKIEKLLPDLIILDIRLEGEETGWKILDLLTLNKKTNKIPVIICTAISRFPDGKEGWLENHGISLLPKPFDINDLLAMIEKSLRKKEAKPLHKELN